MSLAQRIRDRAVELGFDEVAFIPARQVEHTDEFAFWMNEGRNGEMRWMGNYPELRVDPSVLEPGSKTVIALMANYHTGSDRLPGGMRIARYAHGDDYHELLRDKMHKLAAFIHAETGVEVGGRPAVDSAPLLEKDVAMMAGLGWIGKNTLLIRPGLGSFTFLAELLVALDIEAPIEPRVPDRCGTCTACIDACPTGAIVSPYLLDARRCISYLTIELRGPIPRELRPAIGDLLFGCDICQAVCPWNSKVENTDEEAFQRREVYEEMTVRDLLHTSQEEFSTIFRKSAIKRTKRRGLLRNAAVVIGNRGDVDDVGWLSRRLVEEPEPLVRGHIAWALGELGSADAFETLRQAESSEDEEYVLDEIRGALEGDA